MDTVSENDRIEPQVDRGELEEEHSTGCPECGSERFEKDSGETYCLNCGAVVDVSKIDTSREYRAFDAQGTEKKERVGTSITYTKADKGMSTKIGNNSEMNKLSNKKRGQYYRLKKWDNRRESNADSLQKGLNILDRLTFELNLPESVKEEAGRLYEKSYEEDLIKGKSREASIASLIYLVARNQNVPRTQSEISDATGVKERKMNKTYRNIARELDLKIRPADPKNFIPRYQEKLELSGEVGAHARNIIKEAMDKGATSGRSPSSIAAAALYIAALLEDEKVSQRDIGDVAHVTQTTVRKTYRHIAEELELQEELEEVKNQ